MLAGFSFSAPGFVLPTAMLIKIARDPPTTVRQLFGSCHPLPVLLRRVQGESLRPGKPYHPV